MGVVNTSRIAQLRGEVSGGSAAAAVLFMIAFAIIVPLGLMWGEKSGALFVARDLMALGRTLFVLALAGVVMGVVFRAIAHKGQGTLPGVVVKTSNGLANTLLFLPGIVAKALISTLGCLATPMWGLARKLTPTVASITRLDRILITELERPSEGRLLDGDRLAAARAWWPEAEYGWLYKKIPDDVQLPLWFQDGRLPGGVKLSWLADRHMNMDLVAQAARRGVTVAISMLLSAIAVVLAGLVIAGMPELSAAWVKLTAPAPLFYQFPGEDAVRESMGAGMVFSIIGHTLFSLGGDLIRAALVAVMAVPVSGAVGVVASLLLLTESLRRAGQPYSVKTKESEVRWAQRRDLHGVAGRTYSSQVALATGYNAQSPLLVMGHATGVMRNRGDLLAPSAGQVMAFTVDDLLQHLMVFGGSGEGKTTAILKPLARQLLAIPGLGMYGTDAKGVLWHDLAKIAEDGGRADDVIVIGCEDGQWGVDLLDGLDPITVSSILRSVLVQLSGGSQQGDTGPWKDLAAQVIRHALVVARAYECSPQGREEALATRCRPYSLVWAYQALLIDSQLQGVIKHLLDSMMDDTAWTEWAYMIDSPEFRASVDYLAGPWQTMAESTRQSVLLSVSQILDGFSAIEIMRDKFGSGGLDNALTVDQAFQGKIVLNALSTTEYGMPARLASIFLKTLVFRGARLREVQIGSAACRAQPVVFFADEYQESITCDPSNGFSDSTAWNTLRSAGLAGVIATQTKNAFIQAVGEAATNNFLNQFRSVVAMRCEDKSTVDHLEWLSGQHQRVKTFDPNHFETFDQYCQRTGFDPLGENLVGLPEETAGAHYGALSGLLNGSVNLSSHAAEQELFRFDERFIPDWSYGKAELNASVQLARVTAMQQAAWRAEDKEMSWRTEGNDLRPGMTQEDMTACGRFHAFVHLQRAGAVRQDIAEIEHDFS